MPKPAPSPRLDDRPPPPGATPPVAMADEASRAGDRAQRRARSRSGGNGRGGVGGPRFHERLADDMRFLRTWAENPLSTAAVTPSGAMLSRKMAGFVEAWRSGPIVELGPGTGVVTRAMLKRGIPEERLVLVEWNEAFCGLLAERFPKARVVRGDAFAIARTLPDLCDGECASVISGLPLFVKPVSVREALLDDAIRLMAPGAPFIQFSYALVAAVPNRPRRYAIDRSSWVFANLPPARVWTYRVPA